MGFLKHGSIHRKIPELGIEEWQWGGGWGVASTGAYPAEWYLDEEKFFNGAL